MAQPTGMDARSARKPEEKLQLLQQAHAHERSTNLPRVTTRGSSAPYAAPDGERSSESSLVESSSKERGADRKRRADKAPAYTGPTPHQPPAIDDGSAAASLKVMKLDTLVMNPLVWIGSSTLFTVPQPATRHLLKFGETLVSTEKASPYALACLLHHVVSECGKNAALAYSCVKHLLSLGVDVNLHEYRDAHVEAKWQRPLDMAVLHDSVPLLCLLLRHGARPDGAFDMVRMEYGKGNIRLDVTRELLKAGADPWLSLGQPEQVPTSGKHVGVADFYRQTGMDINAEASGAEYHASTLSTLELAYADDSADVLEELLDAGVYVGDIIRLTFGYDQEQHLDAYGPETADAIATYRAQRAHRPCGFAPYTLLRETLQQGPAAAVNTSTSATTTSTSAPLPASGSGLAQAALKPACHALIDGLYSAAAAARLISSLNNMPPAFAQAVVRALALARVLGHYGAGKGAKAGQLDQGIRVALAGAGLWDSYLGCKAQFETLQANIDRHQADGRTLLTMAAAKGKIRMIRILVKLGARVNYPDARGDYPLPAAAKARKRDTCSVLLTLGANAGTTDLQKRSTLFHVADWLTQADISDLPTVDRIAGLIEQLLRLGYDLRQPTPKDHPDHAAYPTVADLLCKPENCIKLALLGPKATGTLVHSILFNIDRRGAQPFLNPVPSMHGAHRASGRQTASN